MIRIEINKEQFIEEFNRHLESGLDPLAALETAFITVGSEYLLQVDKLVLTGFPLGSMEARGKFRDKIFAVQKGTQYIKPYQKPLNPRTLLQQTNRERWKEIALSWQELAESEKAEYNLYALGKPFSGFNLYVKEQYKNWKRY
jgi:hypothetical protein